MWQLSMEMTVPYTLKLSSNFEQDMTKTFKDLYEPNQYYVILIDKELLQKT